MNFNLYIHFINFFTIVGACESVLDSLRGFSDTLGQGLGIGIGGGIGGLLAQEGCRALRHLCYECNEGLERMFKLGVCNVVLGN